MKKKNGKIKERKSKCTEGEMIMKRREKAVCKGKRIE